MAVNFGRLGTVTFGRNANIVCTPESRIISPPPEGVTPSPTPNWVLAKYDDLFANSYTYTVQQIQGITTSITLNITFPRFNVTGNFPLLYYKITATAPSWTDGVAISTSPITNAFTSITNNTNISISNNQYLSFGVIWDGDYFSGTGTVTTTVKNNSAGGTTLDTFSITVIGS